MVNKASRAEIREKKHRRLRHHLNGTATTPRLAVFRSNKHMYAQIIDDTVGKTLVSASTLQKDVKAQLENTDDVAAAAYLNASNMDLIKIGTYIAGKRKALGMTQKQLAEQLGMSDKSVSKWERGGSVLLLSKPYISLLSFNKVKSPVVCVLLSDCIIICCSVFSCDTKCHTFCYCIRICQLSSAI